MSVADLGYCYDKNLTFLSAQDDVTDLWHGRLGYASSSLLNKLVTGPGLKIAKVKIY